MNRLVIVGTPGQSRAYMNIDPEEAEHRFRSSQDYFTDEYEIETFEFDDEFGVYAVWPLEGYTREKLKSVFQNDCSS